ncbi:MAG TPA: HEAT repeat domain-containing protein, partial [Luteolibacter sp.]
KTLPRPKRREEMEAVIGLLRELGERFRGSYSHSITLVLDQIGAARFGCRLLESRWPSQRIRGAALLAWCGSGDEPVRGLEHAIDDRDPRVRLEAAMGLARKQFIRDPERILRALCRDRAAHSLIARDVFRVWGETEPGDWSELLTREWQEYGWVLLLEAAGAAGRAEWVPLIAAKLHHPSRLVVRTALAALEVIGDPNGAGAAKEACRHSDPTVRRQAAKTLSACGRLDECEATLLTLLEDPSFEVRRRALHSLLALGGKTLLAGKPPADDWQRELFAEAGLIAPAAA